HSTTYLFPYPTLFRSSYAKFFLQSDGHEDDGEKSGNGESSETNPRLKELDEVERAIFDGRRYLGLTSFQTLSLTPREFTIEMMRSEEHTSELQSRFDL